MKKQLQEKLSNYKANLSRVTFEPAAVGRFGLASTAALAAMVAVPVELGAQVVCGDQGVPTRTTGPAIGDLDNPFNTMPAVFFDFDKDGTNDLQVVYNSVGNRIAFDPLVAGSWGVRGIGNGAYGTAPASPATFSLSYLIFLPDVIGIVPLSGGGGFGFVSFDDDLYPAGTHPVTGQSSTSPFHGVTMWGAELDDTALSEIRVNFGLTDCPVYPIALPVELARFLATAENKSIQLNWTTATETANAGFEVERSMDGANFRVLQFVEGQGDATEANEYRFEDRDVVAGNEYLYRLKQINFDGTFQYSEVISAELLKAGLQASIFPNPIAGESAQLSVAAPNDEDITVMVFSGNGQRMSVATESVREGSNRLSLDLSDLVAGIYFLKLEQAGETTYEKFVVE